MTLEDPRSRYAGTLSLRETAHLTQHCTLFVGAGSGGTVAASSTSSRSLPMIQLLKKSTSVYASFACDFEYFGITDWPIIEMTNEDPVYIAKCIASVCRDGVNVASGEFNRRVAVTFDYYYKSVDLFLLRQHRYLDAARSLMITARRFGWTQDLIDFGRARIAPNLRLDPAWLFKSNRLVRDELLSRLEVASARPVAVPRQALWQDENN